jgi:hypothetical protein
MRTYKLPDKLPTETNQEWCDRAAASIPAEEIVRMTIEYFHARRHHGGPAWSKIGMILDHGSGVSSAIVRRFCRDLHG